MIRFLSVKQLAVVETVEQVVATLRYVIHGELDVKQAAAAE